MNPITINNQSLSQYLMQQDHINILKSLKESVHQHHLYHSPTLSHIHQRKPRPSKPIIITKQKVFYYYLYLTPKSIQTLYHSLTTTQQSTIHSTFTSTSIKTSSQAINFISTLIQEHTK